MGVWSAQGTKVGNDTKSVAFHGYSGMNMWVCVHVSEDGVCVFLVSGTAIQHVGVGVSHGT